MKTRKFTAMLLVLCLLLTAVPYSAPVHAVEEEHLAQEQTQTETQEQAQVTNETAAETTTAPLAVGVFFQFVDQAVFQANGHVARVPEDYSPEPERSNRNEEDNRFANIVDSVYTSVCVQ